MIICHSYNHEKNERKLTVVGIQQKISLRCELVQGSKEVACMKHEPDR